MGARYPFYLLAGSREGQVKEAEFTRSAPVDQPTYGNIRLGFVYERVPHITLKSIANNAEIDGDAWASLHSDTSRPFEKPSHGRIAVKVINHLGDEVFRVPRSVAPVLQYRLRIHH